MVHTLEDMGEFFAQPIVLHISVSLLSFFRFNLGRPRVVRHQHKRRMKVHRSVKLRMEAAQRMKESHPDEEERESLQAYMPKVKFEVEPEWVD